MSPNAAAETVADGEALTEPPTEHEAAQPDTNGEPGAPGPQSEVDAGPHEEIQAATPAAEVEDDYAITVDAVGTLSNPVTARE